MSPSEYIDYIGNTSVNNYIQNSQNQGYQFVVDQYTDDELFKADFISRMDASEEEAEEALEKAKSNEALFNK